MYRHVISGPYFNEVSCFVLILLPKSFRVFCGVFLAGLTASHADDVGSRSVHI